MIKNWVFRTASLFVFLIFLAGSLHGGDPVPQLKDNDSRAKRRAVAEVTGIDLLLRAALQPSQPACEGQVLQTLAYSAHSKYDDYIRKFSPENCKIDGKLPPLTT